MPKITSIEIQKKNAKRVSIYIDDVYAFGIDAFVAKKYKLEVGKEVMPTELQKVMSEEELEKAKQYTVDYLLGKTTKLIRDKLIQKGYEEETVDKVMTFIAQYKLVDDGDYAKRYANDASKFKKHGKLKIKQSLKQKGITDDDILHALTRINEEDEVLAAKKLLQNKVENYRKKAKNNYELKGKCYQFLMARGYSGDIIERVINQIMVESEEE